MTELGTAVPESSGVPRVPVTEYLFQPYGTEAFLIPQKCVNRIPVTQYLFP